MDCTHRVRSHRPDGSPRHNLEVCPDCGVFIGTRSDAPLWEQILRGASPEKLSPLFDLAGYEPADWLHSELSDYGPRPGFGLAAFIQEGDLQLERDVDANTARIDELYDCLGRVQDHFTREERDSVGKLRRVARFPAVQAMHLAYYEVFGVFVQALRNAISVRAGDYDSVIPLENVNWKLKGTPFSGLRHALHAAFTAEGYEGGIGRGRSRDPDGVESLPLPQGVIFGDMKVAPSRSSTGRAQGEREVISLLDVRTVIAKARLRQRHIQAKDGSFVLDRPGTGPIPPAHMELLRLVLVGEDRGFATRGEITDSEGRTHKSIIPAIDPLRIRDALSSLLSRRPRLPGTPNTEHEARLAFNAARDAVFDALAAAEMIPPADISKLRPTPTHEG